MSKILVLPDIHGRTFWKDAVNNGECDKIIFLGDYVDPYGFENISVETAIENFKEILEYKRENIDKVVLLIGNHDCPYIFDHYFNLSSYHCRHSNMHHEELHKLFNDNIDFFKIAHVENDIIFTHAGIEDVWIKKVVKCDVDDINKVCDALNALLDSNKGIEKLFYISSSRGGMDGCASCVWSDVHDMSFDVERSLENKNEDTIHKFKQIFGHTMQAYYGKDYKICFGKPIEFHNCKMVDTAKAYVIDSDDFTLKDV